MRQKRSFRLPALLLALALLLSTAAQALTPDQARELLTTYYIDEVPDYVLEQSTIADMLEALGDPYTAYYTQEEYRRFTGSMQDQDLVGVGILSSIREEGLFLERIYENTPAAEGGLLAGDLITYVDGRATAGEKLETISDWIRGAEGTQVTLTYLRDGAEDTVTLTRRGVVIPTVFSELWADRIGYLDCDAFGSETLNHMVQGVERYGAQAERWIVDLRENGGGEVAAAVHSAGIFTGPKTLAYLRDSSGWHHSYQSEKEALTGAPVLVLVDQYTASSAELFAAAIRDSGGLVVGSRTYGKGVAQSLFDQDVYPEMFPDGDALKITTSRFYSSIGTTDDSIGVFPHVMVDPQVAEQVAVLLCAPAPAGDTEGVLRLDLGGSWYIDLEQALSEEYRPAFAALLSALSPGMRLLAGNGGGWAVASPAELAERYSLTGYAGRGFSDSIQSRYGAQIDALAAYGILEGSGDGSFRPFDSLSRAELCVLLARTLNCAYPSGPSQFSDVSMDSWYGPSVNALAELGLVTGVGGDEFRPDLAVTHEQLITILGRVACQLNLYLRQDYQQMRQSVLDDETLFSWPGWSRSYVWLLSRSQIDSRGGTISLLWDSLDNITPIGDALRGEAAALTYDLLSYIGILPEQA